MATGEEIRLGGRNMTESEEVKLGAHHTLQLEPHRLFHLCKATWDGLDLARIREACDTTLTADLAVVLITVSLPPPPPLPIPPNEWLTRVSFARAA